VAKGVVISESTNRLRFYIMKTQVAAFEEVLRAQGVDIDPDEYLPVAPTPPSARTSRTESCVASVSIPKKARTISYQIRRLLLENVSRMKQFRPVHDRSIRYARRGLSDACRNKATSELLGASPVASEMKRFSGSFALAAR
jgi:hypothetical protein